MTTTNYNLAPGLISGVPLIQAAIEWTTSLNAKDTPMAYQGLLNTWLKVDSIAASEWLSKQAPGPARDAGAREIIKQIKDTDPQRAEQWHKSMTSQPQ